MPLNPKLPPIVQRPSLRTYVRDAPTLYPGVAKTIRGRYRLVCPVCQCVRFTDDLVEKLCSGPHSSLDEHELTVMIHRAYLEKP